MNTNWTTKDRLGLLVIPVELLISVLIFNATNSFFPAILLLLAKLIS
ncbi:hypothetical protein [Enterococcus bulliens]